MDQSGLVSTPGPAKGTGTLITDAVSHRAKVDTGRATVASCWVSCSLAFSLTKKQEEALF